jgi:ABC-2 type transport system permease protein
VNSIFIIARREFKAYFLTPIAYVYLVTFLVVVNWIFFRSFFLIGQADLRPMFGMMPWIFLFFAPAVAMGKWAEERKLGTAELLFTLPVKDYQIVVAKFAAGLMLVACAVLLTLPTAVTVSLVGDLDWGPVIGGMLGAVLLGGAYLAIGLFFSAFTENQIVAFILGVMGCFVLFIIGSHLITGGAGGLIAHVLQYAALGGHFDSIARGVIDSRDVIYYLSVIVFFLYLNLKVVQTRARR